MNKLQCTEFFVEPKDSLTNTTIVQAVGNIDTDFINGAVDENGRKHQVFVVGGEELLTLFRERDIGVIDFKVFVKDNEILKRISEEEALSFINEHYSDQDSLSLLSDNEIVYLRIQRSLGSLLLNLNDRFEIESGLFKTRLKYARQAATRILRPTKTAFEVFSDKKTRRKITI